MYNEGISTSGTLIDIAASEEIVEKSGSWYAYKDTRIVQGRENAKKYLKDNPDIVF